MNTPAPIRPEMRQTDEFRILAIDDSTDDLRHLESLGRRATKPRCSMSVATGIDGELAAALAKRPHLVILDDCLASGMRGEAAMKALRAEGYHGPVAIVSGVRQPQRYGELIRAGAMIYISKDDLNLEAFYGLIDMAMETSKVLKGRRGA